MYSLEHLQSFTEFAQYKSANRDRIFKFIQLCYSKSSPLIKQFPDLQKRKEQALLGAGLEPKNFDLDREDIAVLVDVYLCKIQSSNQWDSLISFQECLWESHRVLRAPVWDFIDQDKQIKALETKHKLVAAIETYTTKIEDLYKVIFHSDDKLIDASQKKIRRITPEMMARQKPEQTDTKE